MSDRRAAPRSSIAAPADRPAFNRPGFWECFNCTAHNRDERNICGVCNTQRKPVVILASPIPMAPLATGTIFIDVPHVLVHDLLADLQNFLMSRGHQIERTYHTLSIVTSRPR